MRPWACCRHRSTRPCASGGRTPTRACGCQRRAWARWAARTCSASTAVCSAPTGAQCWRTASTAPSTAGLATASVQSPCPAGLARAGASLTGHRERPSVRGGFSGLALDAGRRVQRPRFARTGRRLGPHGPLRRVRQVRRNPPAPPWRSNPLTAVFPCRLMALARQRGPDDAAVGPLAARRLRGLARAGAAAGARLRPDVRHLCAAARLHQRRGREGAPCLCRASDAHQLVLADRRGRGPLRRGPARGPAARVSVVRAALTGG